MLADGYVEYSSEGRKLSPERVKTVGDPVGLKSSPDITVVGTPL